MKLDYSRQQAIKAFNVPTACTVIGVGAVGTWTSYFAALAGISRILLYAIGPVKQTDIARLPFPPTMADKPYGYALPSLLYSIRPDVKLNLHERFVPETSIIEGVLFNCAASDEQNFDERVSTRASKEGAPYISGGYDEDFVFAMNGFDKNLPSPSLKPGPVWAGMAAMTAAMMVDAACRASPEAPNQFGLDLRKKGMRTLSAIANYCR